MKLLEKMIDTGKKIVTGAAIIGITSCSAANYNTQPQIETNWKPGISQTETGYEVVDCAKGFDKRFTMELAADNVRHRINRLFDAEETGSVNLASYASQYKFNDSGHEVCYKIIIPRE
jgi:hypothetical protein